MTPCFVLFLRHLLMGNHNYANLIGMKALKCQTVKVVTPPVARTSFMFASKVYNNIVSLYEQSHLKVAFTINFVNGNSLLVCFIQLFCKGEFYTIAISECS